MSDAPGGANSGQDTEIDFRQTEDDLFRLQDDAQKETDKFIKQIDGLMADKEKEVMEV